MAGSMDDTIAASWASGALGLNYEIARSKRLAEALKEPDSYFEKRGTELGKIQTSIIAAFANKFDALKNLGVAPSDAQRRAEQYAAALYQAETQQLNLDYPASINELAANLTYKQGAASKSGLDVATTVKRSGRKRTTKKK